MLDISIRIVTIIIGLFLLTLISIFVMQTLYDLALPHQLIDFEFEVILLRIL